MSSIRIVPVLAILACITAASASAFTIRSDHPRIFVTEEDLPRLRARCGIVDGDNQTVYADQWQTQLTNYNRLVSEVAPYPATFNTGADACADTTMDQGPNGGDQMSNIAALYLLNAHRAEGNVYRDKLMTYLRTMVDNAICRHGGKVGGTIPGNDYGKSIQQYPTWMGYAMAYDYIFDYLTTADSTALRDSLSVWMYKQGRRTYYAPDNNPNRYYNAPWVRDGAFGSFLACHGDPALAPYAAELDSLLEITHDAKVEDNLAREYNFCGTYSGYRDSGKRVGEDVVTALAWDSAVTDEDPFADFPSHYMNLDDWFMYQLTGAYHDSDETGDEHDLGPLFYTNLYWYYPSAVRDQNGAALWLMEEYFADYFLTPHVDQNAFKFNGGQIGQIKDIPWVWIFFDDKTIPRVPPTPATHPLGRYFGDLTFQDGRNSQYTHMRSDWNFAQDNQNSVVVSYFCGPTLGIHDSFVNGHIAFFRGRDILSSTTGFYDSSARGAHGERYFLKALSHNTIQVMDPNTTYDEASDSIDVYYFREGLQHTWFGDAGVRTPEEPFTEYAFGAVDRFQTFDNGDAYLHSDLTEGYPNDRRPDVWTEGGLVENCTRQVTFTGGKFVVICDRVTSVNPAAVKRVIMHVNNPEGVTLLDGSWDGGVAPHPVLYGGTPGEWSTDALRYTWRAWQDSSYAGGKSRVYATVLYPKPAALEPPGRNLVRVGGANSAGEWNRGRSPRNPADPSYEFYFRQMGVNYCGTLAYEGGEERVNGSYGYWRTEIEATGQQEHAFLHAYEITAVGQAVPDTVDYLAALDDDHVGCEIRTAPNGRIVIFSRDEQPDTSVIYESALPAEAAPSPLLHLVADLQPGEYRVENLDTGWHISVAVDEKSMLASFETPGGGRFRLERVGRHWLTRR